MPRYEDILINQSMIPQINKYTTHYNQLNKINNTEYISLNNVYLL